MPLELVKQQELYTYFLTTLQTAMKSYNNHKDYKYNLYGEASNPGTLMSLTVTQVSTNLTVKVFLIDDGKNMKLEFDNGRTLADLTNTETAAYEIYAYCENRKVENDITTHAPPLIAELLFKHIEGKKELNGKSLVNVKVTSGKTLKCFANDCVEFILVDADLGETLIRYRNKELTKFFFGEELRFTDDKTRIEFFEKVYVPTAEKLLVDSFETMKLSRHMPLPLIQYVQRAPYESKKRNFGYKLVDHGQKGLEIVCRLGDVTYRMNFINGVAEFKAVEYTGIVELIQKPSSYEFLLKLLEKNVE